VLHIYIYDISRLRVNQLRHAAAGRLGFLFALQCRDTVGGCRRDWPLFGHGLALSYDKALCRKMQVPCCSLYSSVHSTSHFSRSFTIVFLHVLSLSSNVCISGYPTSISPTSVLFQAVLRVMPFCYVADQYNNVYYRVQ